MDPSASSETAAEALRARTATVARGRAFLLRLGLTLAGLALYEASGASAQLLAGLHARFEGAWWPVHLLYLALSTAALGALMMPVSLYEDFVVEARESGLETQFEDWVPGLIRNFAIDLAGGVALFLLFYGLLAWFPRAWWAVGAAIYGLVSWGLSLIPMLQGPKEDELAELHEPALRERLTALLGRAGFPDYRLLRWRGEAASETSMLAILGLGRRRRVVISEAMLNDYADEEIEALLAHELGHPKHADIARYNLLGALLALAAFGAADLGTRGLVALFGRPPIEHLASYPLLASAVLLASFLCLPVMNAYSRRREYAADAFAHGLTSGSALRSALEKLGGTTANALVPAGILDLLVHNQPDFAHRLQRLARMGSP